MNGPPNEVHSSEDARKKADYHRQQISDTLDVLGDKISHTVETAEQQLNRPLQVIRAYPFSAVGASIAAGFLLAFVTARRRSRKTSRAEALAQAYYEGRRDEQEHVPLRQAPYWQNPELYQGGSTSRLSLRGLARDLALPLVRIMGGRIADRMVSGRGRR